ncbi:WD repeat-containing protein 44-like [Carica papaya]|uniref:WD repeat-containing protein 44-like n=1 Tax=Carica papaya TaxID=3649 RepID=UPI000B8C7E01|nr:WD repeat-containing protein 44-like [Carica papaya]
MDVANRLDRRKTLTMNWAGLGDHDDDDDRFFESCDRISSVMSLDLASSGSDEDDDDYDDCRISFASAVSSIVPNKEFRAPAMSPDYDIWMAAPGSIKERRKRLLHGMGLAADKNLLRVTSVEFKRAVSVKPVNGEVPDAVHDDSKSTPSPSPPVRVLLVRSRSESDIESFSVDKIRKEEILGVVSKQRLTRTSSTIAAQCARICPYQTPARTPLNDGGHGRSPGGGSFTPLLPNGGFGAFFLIKNLDTGKEFIVKEYDEDGMWNRLSDLQTGKQLTMEEFEKCVGYSPVVKELMRRENVNRMQVEGANIDFRKFNSYLSKSLRMSKRRGAALLKNIKGVANSMSLRVNEKEKEIGNIPAMTDPKQGKNGWVKVRQTGKSYKELSALHLSQEIQAHQGSIWTIKFSLDAHLLASAGEDRVIHVWEVQECEIMSMNEGSLTPLHPSMDKPSIGEVPLMPSEKKKKGKGSSAKKGNHIPDYVHAPETVFSLSEKPICSFKGHLDDVLDLSWSRSQLLLSSSMDKTVRLWDLESRSCLKLFAHNDYVTCIQFNPTDDDYFISGSLDAKVRIWNIPDRYVVDWTDIHEMVTSACYTPDGQGAFVGTHKGSCRLYNTEGCKLTQQTQIDLRIKKKSHGKKVTGFQFSPGNPSEVLVTSADSRIRILDGAEIIHKFRGFRNTSSQIAASFSLDGKHIICASEDSHVYVWKHDDSRNASTGKRTVTNTRSHEQFQCRDVSVAIPWPGTIKGDLPPMPLHSKRHSRRISSQPPSVGSPTKEDSSAVANSKRMLPPLPKKVNPIERTITPPEEDLVQISRSESGIGESFSMNSPPSITSGDSPSISAASNSNSDLVTHGDSPSISATAAASNHSASISHGDSPSISATAAALNHSSSIRNCDSPSISAASNINSASIRNGDSFSISAAVNTNSPSIKYGDSLSISSASRCGDSPSISASSHAPSSSWSSSWSWFDVSSHGAHTIQPTAWGMVIVTATLGGEIRTYQNFGLPRRLGRQANLF